MTGRPGFATGLALALSVAGFAAPSALASSDYNGDGRQDLAVSVPFENLPGAPSAGGLHVLYGGHGGLNPGRGRFLSVAAANVPGEAKIGASFSLSFPSSGSYDFNKDGFDDFATGAPLDDLSDIGERIGNAGSLYVFEGSSRGLTAKGSRRITEDTKGIPSKAAYSELFGTATAGGDFDGDGYDDLAVGAIDEHNGPGELSPNQAGGVFVLSGSRSGLETKQASLLTPNTPGVAGGGSDRGDWGFNIQAGDFDGDGYDDLAVGDDDREVDGEGYAGSVTVLFGSPHGLRPFRSQYLSEAAAGPEGAGPQFGDNFGRGLASADIDADGYADLAIGAASENGDDGAAFVFYGSPEGLESSRSQMFSRDTPGLASGISNFAHLGLALRAGDLNGDGYPDLAIGAPYSNSPAPNWMGSVSVLFGSADGLTLAGNQRLDQSTAEMRGDGYMSGDVFGAAIAIANVNDSKPDELIIGEPQYEADYDIACHPGGVHILYPDTHGGLLALGNRFYTEDTPGLAGGFGAVPCESFGRMLAAG